MFGDKRLDNISWKENKEDGTITICGEKKKGNQVIYACMTYTQTDGKLVPLTKGEGDPEVLLALSDFVRNKFRVTR